MDFSKILNQNLNNMLGGNVGLEGGGVMVWVVVLVVVLVAVGGYMYMNEYFGCNTGRASVDGKCVDLCPAGFTFKSTDGKATICTGADGKDVPYAVPTPTPAPTAAPVTTSPAATTTPVSSSK